MQAVNKDSPYTFLYYDINKVSPFLKAVMKRKTGDIMRSEMHKYLTIHHVKKSGDWWP